jgi:hypothetical protein
MTEYYDQVASVITYVCDQDSTDDGDNNDNSRKAKYNRNGNSVREIPMEVILRAPSCIKPSGRYCPRDEEGEDDYDLARIMFSKSSQNSTHDSAL